MVIHLAGARASQLVFTFGFPLPGWVISAEIFISSVHLGFLICERGGSGLLRGLNDFRYAAPFLRRCPAHRLRSVAGLIVVSTRGSAGLEEPQGSGSLAHPT